MGEDGGGPRRELWRLFGLSLKGTYFEGEGSKLLPRHDTVALQVCLDMQGAYSIIYSYAALPLTFKPLILCAQAMHAAITPLIFAFQSNIFFSIGCLMATSIAQGGSGYPFLCKDIYDYLCGRDVTALDYTVIPDPDIKAILDKVRI